MLFLQDYQGLLCYVPLVYQTLGLLDWWNVTTKTLCSILLNLTVNMFRLQVLYFEHLPLKYLPIYSFFHESFLVRGSEP